MGENGRRERERERARGESGLSGFLTFDLKNSRIGGMGSGVPIGFWLLRGF